MKNLFLAMTLAPRQQWEHNETIKKMREAWLNGKITIFAEPWEYEIEDENINLIIHKEKKGCFKNFDFTLKECLKTGAEYFLIMQDDCRLSPDVLKRIKKIITARWDKFGFISMNTTQIKSYIETEIYKQGWNSNEWWWWFCPAVFLFSKWWAEQIIKHSFYINHLENYVKNKQIDWCIWETCKQLWLEMYNHNPSNSIQKGKTSTIGHNGALIQKTYWKKETKKIIGGIASIPDRVKELEISVKSLVLQVDKLYISLNWYKTTPNFLLELKKEFDITIKKTNNERGDIEKFFWLRYNKKGYYFTFDDDLDYSPNYVKYLVKKLEEYDDEVVVGIHGVIMNKEIKSYYKDREVIHFKRENINDKQVNILGTGTTAFDIEKLKITTGKWKHPNMSDIYFWIEAQKQDIKMVCLGHTGNEIKEIRQDNKKTIFWDNFKNDEKQTELANSIIWNECLFEKKNQIKDKKIFSKKGDKMIKVKLLRKIHPHKKWEVIFLEERKVKYWKRYCEIIDDKLPQKENKAILFNANNKKLW